MSNLKVELKKMHKAVLKRALEMFNGVDTVSISYDSGCGYPHGVRYIHVHMQTGNMVSFKLKVASSIKKVLQQMTDENIF